MSNMPLARFRRGAAQQQRWRALVLLSVALTTILSVALWAAHLHAPATRAAGSLSFAPYVDYPIGGVNGAPAITSVALGDFNGDGNLDLATTNSNFPVVNVLFGSGGGAFGQEDTYRVNGSPTSVAIGDFNGDTSPDLAVADSGGVSLLLGGFGAFTPLGEIAIPNHPNSVVMGDLNGDGKLDLITASDTGEVGVLLGFGTAAFGPPQYYMAGPDSRAVTVANLNKDAFPDVAVANGTANTVSGLPGAGNGVLGAPLTFPVETSPTALAAGDLNGDGKLDLAVANAGSNDVSLLFNTPTGLAPAPGFPVMGGPTSVAISDLDGDGAPDVAAADGNSSSVDVALGDSLGHFIPPAIFQVGGPPGSMAVGDLNGDGKPDVVTRSSGAVSVLLNTTGSAAPTPTPTSTPTGRLGDTTVTLTLTGGELSATTNSAPTLTAALTGQDQTLTYPLPISVTDATASGAGWNLTLASTQFTTGGPGPHTLPADASRVTGATAACAANVACVAPVNGVVYPLTVSAGNNLPAVKLFSAAANSGLGAFTITPTVSVFVPAGAYAGTYTCTLSLAIVSGP
jgi:hypothetical protein